MSIPDTKGEKSKGDGNGSSTVLAGIVVAIVLPVVIMVALGVAIYSRYKRMYTFVL